MKTLKRHCNSKHSISNPNNNSNQSNMQHTLLESFITITNPTSLTTSFNQIIESQSTHSQQFDFIQRAIDISYALLEAAIISRCQLLSAHNAQLWPLPYDVTVKVLSMIDTQSVCNAAATCSFFNKCAMDPLCYADIDLVTLVPKVNDAAVSTMVQRAGKALQSIKLGIMPEDADLWPGDVIESPILTSSCLKSLNGNAGALGINEASRQEDLGKLGPNWEGPYQVTEAFDNGSYKLKTMDDMEVPRTWHAINLRRCYL